MRYTNDFKQQLMNTSPEEKLAILRSEARRILSSIRGYSTIIRNLVHERGVPQMPDDFETWCNKVVEGSEDIDELISLLTSVTLMPEENHVESTTKDNDNYAPYWKLAVQSIPELRPFQNLQEALIEEARQLGLDRWIDNEQNLVSYAMSTNIGFRTPDNERIASFELSVFDDTETAASREVRYHITLLEWGDRRNLKRRGYHGIATSLADTLVSLNFWLVEGTQMDVVRTKFQWLNSEAT